MSAQQEAPVDSVVLVGDEVLEGRESHVEAPGSAEQGSGGVDGRSEGLEGRSGGMG